MISSSLTLLLVGVWGIVVGLDLVSVPQGLFARPLVAGTVAGWLAGDLAAGLVAGAVLELYALEFLPIGATRYPDFGVAAVVAGVAAAAVEPALRPAVAGLVGLPTALLGDWSLHRHRRRNAQSIQRRLARVTEGDATAIWELQRNALIRDAGRALALTVAGLLLACAIVWVPLADLPRAGWLSVAVVVGGAMAAGNGARRAAAGGRQQQWLVAGICVGLMVVLLQ